MCGRHFDAIGPHASWFAKLYYYTMLRFSVDLMETLASCVIGINIEYDVWNSNRSDDSAMERMICYYVHLITILNIKVHDEVDWKWFAHIGLQKRNCPIGSKLKKARN